MPCIFCHNTSCICPQNLKAMVASLSTKENFIFELETEHNATKKFLLKFPHYVFSRIIYVTLGGRKNFKVAFLVSSGLTYSIVHSLIESFLTPPAWLIYPIRIAYVIALFLEMESREKQIETINQFKIALIGLRKAHAKSLLKSIDNGSLSPLAINLSIKAFDHLVNGYLVSEGKTDKKIETDKRFKQPSSITERIERLSPSPCGIFCASIKTAATTTFSKVTSGSKSFIKTSCIIL